MNILEHDSFRTALIFTCELPEGMQTPGFEDMPIEDIRAVCTPNEEGGSYAVSFYAATCGRMYPIGGLESIGGPLAARLHIKQLEEIVRQHMETNLPGGKPGMLGCSHTQATFGYFLPEEHAGHPNVRLLAEFFCNHSNRFCMETRLFVGRHDLGLIATKSVPYSGKTFSQLQKYADVLAETCCETIDIPAQVAEWSNNKRWRR